MFERFTIRARRAVILAQEEARRLNHNFIGSEHVLLGVLRMIDGPVETLLSQLGITADAVQQTVVAIVGSGRSQPAEHIPFTRGGKQALTSALHFALRLGDNDIGVEHILLGLLDLPDTVEGGATGVDNPGRGCGLVAASGHRNHRGLTAARRQHRGDADRLRVHLLSAGGLGLGRGTALRRARPPTR